MSDAPAGMTRFVVKSKFGVDRDFEALGPDGERAWFVDGKFGLRPAADVQDAAGVVAYRLKGRLMGVPKVLTVSDPEDNEVATIKAKFSPLKSRMIVTLADGTEWMLEGNLIEREYTITSGDHVVAHITQKYLTVRDAYTIDVADGVHPGLAMAILWAVDAFREQR
ncbi:MAG TPA: LURP-one-related family protein [Arachnia sp.]|nr:LURP-one-related family protein [Arachnia sp.]